MLNPAVTEAAFASPTIESAPAMAAAASAPAQESPVDEYVSQAELDRRFFAAGGQSRLRLGPPVLVARPTPVPVAVAPPTPPKAERPEWIELIESLRLDLERLRAERTQPAPAVNVAHTSPAKGRAKQPPPEETESTQDQWGLFDPEQCGFAALVAKLEEITDVSENVSA